MTHAKEAKFLGYPKPPPLRLVSRSSSELLRYSSPQYTDTLVHPSTFTSLQSKKESREANERLGKGKNMPLENDL